MTPTAQSVKLTLQNHKHSKSYSASLEQGDGGWVVNFSYGAIGAMQKPGTKTKSPVDYEKALGVYNKLVASKTQDPCDCCGAVYVGYGESAAVLAAVENPHPAHHGFSPELLEPATEAEVERFINDSNYGLERKYDGQRLSISHMVGETIGYNKLGKVTPAPPDVVEKLLTIKDLEALQIDGEYVGGQHVAFDLLFDHIDVRSWPKEKRHTRLKQILHGTGIKVSELVTGAKAKRAAYDLEKANRGEGVVFKLLDAPYMPGRQGLNRKLKFWESATVRVCSKTKNLDAHSFAVEAYVPSEANEDRESWNDPYFFVEHWVPLGNVTCKGPLPEIGTYREVEYLYVGAGGSLYQAEDLGSRTDVNDADCLYSKLKQKQAYENLA